MLTTLNPHAVRRSSASPAPQCTVDVEFSFAFQPIVNAATQTVISFEALVRGPHGEPSSEVFSRILPEDLYSFDQTCRLKALAMAARLNLRTSLNLNFFPNSRQRSTEYLWATVEASRQLGFSAERLVFEVTEAEALRHRGTVEGVFDTFGAIGLQTAIDDFGKGFSSLRRLAEYRPNYVKLDRDLIADIHLHRVKQVIVRGIRSICHQLAITPVAEGVEKCEEYHWLRQAGIDIFQGYYFARPSFEALAEVRPALY